MALDKFQPYLFVSAGEQSNKFLTPTYSGGIAQFQAQRAQQLTKLLVQIDPVQSGSGDPSPTNVRAISGRTGLTVTAAGKNMMPVYPVNRSENPSITTDGDVYTINGTAPGYIQIVADGTFTLSAGDYYFKVFTISGTGRANVQLRSADGLTTYASIFSDIPNSSGATFNLAEDTEVKFRITAASDATFSNLKIQCMVSKGTTAPTTYEPYHGVTYYPITWETEAGTVYGGTLDVVSGELIVTHGLVAFDGSENWILSRESTEGCYVQLNSLVKTNNYIGKILCDKLSTFSLYNNDAYKSAEYGITAFAAGINYPNQNWIYAKNERNPTVESFKAWLSENPITICYYLANPQTYRLTGAEVRTIAGFNQIYSDAGPVIDIQF